jgi:hypothetical protein
MRLLLTAELHYRLSWFKWLEAQAVHYEVIAICGDLLDVFYKEAAVSSGPTPAALLHHFTVRSIFV